MKTIKSILLGALVSLSFSATSFAEAELDGYCPVCYVAAGKAVKGTEKLQSEHEGETYYFVSDDAKAAFDKSPESFLPAFDGYCAYGVSLGKKLEADPTQFSVVDGVIYLSSNEEVKKKFDVNPEKFIAEAHAKWEMISK